MMRAVREERPIEVFWHTLVDLVACGRVRLDDKDRDSHAPMIGKAYTNPHYVWVSTEVALAEVQKSLRDQGRPHLALRPADIPALLRKEGKLLDKSGQPVPADFRGPVTHQRRLPAGELRRGFIVSRQVLDGAADTE
jgi:hypothetical protein